MAPPFHSDDYPNRLYATPGEYFTEGPEEGDSQLLKASTHVLAASVGPLGILLYNYGTRRPLYAGIQKYVVTSLVGLGIFHLLWKNRVTHLNTRDAMFRHYIDLHPEDFPPIERKKMSEIFHSWIPVR